jgi:hypothetical protein
MPLFALRPSQPAHGGTEHDEIIARNDDGLGERMGSLGRCSPVSCRAELSPFLRFELPDECSEMRGDGSRQRVVLVLQASANLPDCEVSNASIASGT